MDIADLKRRLRRMKRIELHLRYGRNEIQNPYLIWNRFFSLSNKQNVRYPMSDLLGIDEAAFQTVYDEYMAYVYSDYYSHDYYTVIKSFDRRLLAQLDLADDADEDAVKKRFRELALKHHPDRGGDPERFIQLVNLYRELME